MNHPTVDAAAKALKDFHRENGRPFAGTLRINTEDAQAIVDEMIAAQPEPDHSEPPTHPRVKHGDVSTLFGKRCVADDSVDPGTIEMEPLA